MSQGIFSKEEQRDTIAKEMIEKESKQKAKGNASYITFVPNFADELKRLMGAHSLNEVSSSDLKVTAAQCHADSFISSKIVAKNQSWCCHLM